MKTVLLISTAAALLASAATVPEVAQAVSNAEVLDAIEAVEAAALPPDAIVAVWSIVPGLVGGLIVQLLRSDAIKRKQLAGELMASGAMGFIAGPWILDHVDGFLKLGGLCVVCGGIGSAGFFVLIEGGKAFSRATLTGLKADVVTRLKRMAAAWKSPGSPGGRNDDA